MNMKPITLLSVYLGLMVSFLWGEVNVNKLSIEGGIEGKEGELVIRAQVGEQEKPPILVTEASGEVKVVDGQVEETWILKLNALQGEIREVHMTLGQPESGAEQRRSRLAVQGEGLMGWNRSWNDLVLVFDKPLDQKSRTVRVVRTTPLALATASYQVWTPIFTKGDYNKGTIRVHTGNGYVHQMVVMRGEGVVGEHTHGVQTFTYVGGMGKLELQFSEYPDLGYQLKNSKLHGNLLEDHAEFLWSADVEVTRPLVIREKEIDTSERRMPDTVKEKLEFRLLGVNHALLAEAKLGGGQLILREDGYWLRFEKPGVYPVSIRFTSKVNRRGEMNNTYLDLASDPVRQLQVTLPSDDYQVKAGDLILAANTDGEAVLPLPPEGGVHLVWEPIAEAGGERAFFTVEGLREIRIHNGMVDQVQSLKYRVSQGEVRSLDLQLEGNGEILSVKAPGLLSWKVEPEQGESRTLTVELNQAQKGEFDVHIEAREALGDYPAVFSPLSIKPEQALRYVGYVRVGFGESSKISVLESSGMTQIASQFYPQASSPKGKSLESALVFRHGGPEFSLSLRAEQVVPQLYVSQLLFYLTSLSGRQIEAEFDVEVRDAPVQRLDIQIPEGYLVANVSGASVSDFSMLENGEHKTVAVFLSKALLGRELIRVQLEQTEDFQPATWTLQPVRIEGAELRRGFLGVGSSDGVRILPGEGEGLSEIAPAYLPRTPDAVYLAWRMDRPEWQLAVESVMTERSVKVDAFHLFTGAEDALFGSSILNISVSGAPVQNLTFSVPENYRNLDFVGEGVRSARIEQGNVQLTFNAPVAGSFTVLGTYEINTTARGEKISFRGVKPEFEASEIGTVVLVSPLPFRVVEKTGKAEVLDTARIPEDFQLLYQAPVVAAYQYNESAADLDLVLTSLTEAPRIEQGVDSLSAHTLIGHTGEVVTNIDYVLQSNRAAYMALELPYESQLWEVKVAGNAVQPVDNHGYLLIPLPAEPDEAGRYPVSLSLAHKYERGKDWMLELPRMSIPALKAVWTVEAEEGYYPKLERAFVEPVRWVGTTDSWDGRVLLGAFIGMLATFFPAIYLIALLRRRGTSISARLGLGFATIVLVFGWMLAIGVFVTEIALTPRSVAVASSLRFQTEVVPADTSIYAKLKLAETYSMGQVKSHYYLWGIGILVGVAALVVCCKKPGHTGGILLGVLSAGLLVYSLISGITELPLLIITLMAICFLLLGLSKMRLSSNISKVAVGGLLLAVTFAAAPEMASAATVAKEMRLPVIEPYQESLGVADEVLHKVEIGKEQVVVQSRVVWNAREGDHLFLLETPAILRTARFDESRVQWLTEEGHNRISLLSRAAGRHVIEYETVIPVGAQRQGNSQVTLPLAAGHYSTAEVRVTGMDSHRVESSRAVRVVPAEQADQPVKLVLYPSHRIDLTWGPKPRDLSQEEALYYADATHLVQPVPGAILMRHQFRLRFAQGSQGTFFFTIPEGQIVSSVDSGNVALWSFDVEKQTLEVRLTREASSAESVVFYTETPEGNLPFEAQTAFPIIQGARQQVGQVRLATTDELQVEAVKGEGMMGSLAGGESVTSLEGAEAAPLVVREAFRYTGDGATLAFRALPVDAEISVDSQQILTVGEDRTLLSVRTELSIDRAGLFALQMRIPDGYDLESLSENSLSHWTYVDENKNLIQLNFKERLRGKISLAVVLSGPGYAREGQFLLPKVEFPRASRERGLYQVSPELGLKVDLAESVRSLPANPEEEGMGRIDGLLLKVLGTEWSAKLNLTRLEPWVQVDTLQNYRYGEGRVEVKGLVSLQVENAGVKQLRLTVPDAPAALVVRHPQIANVRKESDNRWLVTFDRRVIGRVDLNLSYDLANPEGANSVQTGVVRVLDASRERRFMAIYTDPVIQLYPDQSETGISPILWNNIPEKLRAGNSAPASNLIYRIAGEQNEVAFRIHRLQESGDILAARVVSTRIRSRLSDSGYAMTETLLSLHPGEERYLRIRLQPDEQLWTVTVNGETAWVWYEDEDWLVPLIKHSVPGQETEVVLFVAKAVGSPRTVKSVVLNAPQFSLPLENIQWSVHAPKHWQIDGDRIKGDLRQLPGVDYFYEEWEEDLMGMPQPIRRESESVSAQQLYSLGNQLLREGRVTEANRAFGSSYNLSQNDGALNQDALVQWNEVRKQQAITGITQRRGLISEETGPSVAPQPRQNLAVPVERPQEAEALAGLVQRLIEQQNAALVIPAPYTIELPDEEGQTFAFHRPVLVENWASMDLEIPLGKKQEYSFEFWFALLIGSVTLVSIYFFSYLISVVWTRKQTEC